MPLDISKRVAVMFFIADRLEATALRPNPSLHPVADCLRGRFLRDADLMSCLLAIVGQLSQQMYVHAADAGNEKAIASVGEYLDETITDGCTKTEWEDDRLASDRFAVVVQPGVFTFGRRVLVIA